MAKQSLLLQSAARTIEIELEATRELLNRLDGNFASACERILQCKGRVVVMGVGKSGHIARKLAATLASTGTPALFVHPAEASHGDLGMITGDDVVIALSNSGSTEEILKLLPVLKRKGSPLIAITGKLESDLARAADEVLDASVSLEACPLGLAPTSSTTVSLVLGDAIAMALLEARGFTRDDFAMSHPGGNLGRRLLVKVRDLMHTGSEIPRVNQGTRLSEALIEMSSKGFGFTTVIDREGLLAGVFTDGDLRRTVDSGCDLQNQLIDDVMSASFKSITPDALASEAARIMQENNVYVLVVTRDSVHLDGVLKMHDLLQANVV